ncbi:MULTISPECIES: hypothetical protein [Methylobacterium]|uniref:Uncharacterized protein n=1 Tax=Methylobacterium jeotgali TaxID=381630 RepID=A0ABQ4T008_9HYPH|nr:MULTISPECIES: hypothetical protein [Methylobacterium]PIU06942.1 MAG: hypothetical protein COT56_07375 [Methylobacterium sp. CG09_land_8_20_14_0_10_71_15]PIU16154.1 MAG: hypothetical protein COT28_01695 [Methylobacterium sp. CG08_land_8_20_14_0_20_71_15]GBU18064.1 hypothetical protein AwMethylo_22790 [Methylobacterium sp.]GJE08667.1 hypothetical protein AOPFMNJM_4010 [Methylobacterium jeotgali]
MSQAPVYGPLKLFRSAKSTAYARTKAEAAIKLGVEVSAVQGPRFTDALRGEPTGKRRHPEVAYLDSRAVVRRLNRSAA